MIQLNPPIPLQCPQGKWKGYAHFVTDMGMEVDLIWTIFQEDGEIWCRQNRDVRAVNNVTFNRNLKTEAKPWDGMQFQAITPMNPDISPLNRDL